MLLRSCLKTASENANEFSCSDNYVPNLFHKQPNWPSLQKTATFIDFGKDEYSDIEVVTVWTTISREEGENGNSFEQVTELGQALKIVCIELIKPKNDV